MSTQTNSDHKSISVPFGDFVFEESPSTVLADAVRQYEVQQDTLHSERDSSLKVLSLIGDWVVGKEPVL